MTQIANSKVNEIEQKKKTKLSFFVSFSFAFNFKNIGARDTQIEIIDHVKNV